MSSRIAIRWLQRGLLFIGLVLICAWSRTYFESRGFQSTESAKLEASLREAESAGPLGEAAVAATRKSDGSPMTSGRVLGRIEIPRLRIGAIVAEGSNAKTLRRAVGHVTQTALPGHPGNCALAGHRDTYLRGLGAIRVDDVIRIVTLEGRYVYRVEWIVIVEPRQVEVLDSTAAPSLTLVTCYPFAFVGHAPQRFVVRARQVVGDSMTLPIAGPARARRL